MRAHRLAVILAFTLLPAAALADGGKLRGSVGAGAGFGVVTGRSLIVDSVSGASTKDDVDRFTKGVFVSGITVDLGIVAAGPGSFGLHLALDGSAPGPYFAAELLPRYRWHLGAVNPWVGVGFGVALKDDADGPFFGFPVAAGCELELGFGAFLTGEVDVTMINPWGPEHTGMTDAGPQKLEDHMNRVTVKLGLAWPFY